MCIAIGVVAENQSPLRFLREWHPGLKFFQVNRIQNYVDARTGNGRLAFEELPAAIIDCDITKNARKIELVTRLPAHTVKDINRWNSGEVQQRLECLLPELSVDDVRDSLQIIQTTDDGDAIGLDFVSDWTTPGRVNQGSMPRSFEPDRQVADNDLGAAVRIQEQIGDEYFQYDPIGSAAMLTRESQVAYCPSREKVFVVMCGRCFFAKSGNDREHMLVKTDDLLVLSVPGPLLAADFVERLD